VTELAADVAELDFAHLVVVNAQKVAARTLHIPQQVGKPFIMPAPLNEPLLNIREAARVPVPLARVCEHRRQIVRPGARHSHKQRASAHRCGYTRAWRKLARTAIAIQPYCSECGRLDDLTVITEFHSHTVGLRRQLVT
jgi:hypothetical protein